MARNWEGARRLAGRCLIVLFVFSLVPIVPLAAQEPGDGGSAVERELVELNLAVRELVSVIRESFEGQQVELLMKRVELSRQGLGPLETELRSVRNKRSSTEDRALSLENQVRMTVGEDVDFDDLGRVELEYEEERLALLRTGGQIKTLKDRVWQLDQRILELESDLERKSEDIAALEAQVDERLGLNQ